MSQYLTASQKQKIARLYLSGVKPSEIARKMGGMKPASLRQHLYREGLTKRREEIAAVKQRTAWEVLESVRQHSVADFEAVLGLLGDGLKIDARKLRDGWHLVEDAAGASSLMRAKSLLFDRTLRTYGVEKADDGSQSGTAGLNLFFFAGNAEPLAKSEPRQVEPVDDAETKSGAAT